MTNVYYFIIHILEDNFKEFCLISKSIYYKYAIHAGRLIVFLCIFKNSFKFFF